LTGRYKEAERVYHETIERFPNNVVARNGLAEVLKAAGRYEEAEGFFRETIKRFPDNVVARNGLAEVLKAAGRYEEAEGFFRETIKRFPDNVVAYTGLADTLRYSGYFDIAEDEYRSCIKSNHVNPATFIGLAYLVLRKGKEYRSEVLNLTNQALKLDPLNRYTLRLKQNLSPQNQGNLDFENLVKSFEKTIDALLDASVSTSSEEEAIQVTAVVNSPSFEQRMVISETMDAADYFESIKSKHPASYDPITFEALVAEAHFYRTWAIGAEKNLARSRRQKAVSLLNQAEQLSPQDAQVFAERAALMTDEGNKSDAYQNVTFQLGRHPAAASLLVLKARLDREKAREEKRPMNASTFSELCIFPQRLGELNTALTPLFYFQKGLAALSLLDGELRIKTASEFLSKFRQTLARRATEEQTDRKKQSRFHEWLQLQTDRRFFAALPEKEKVRPDDIPSLASKFVEHGSEVHEIEDMFVDRLVFGNI
jgi:tetratricopeptide (TPR) repeat protein